MLIEEREEEDIDDSLDRSKRENKDSPPLGNSSVSGENPQIAGGSSSKNQKNSYVSIAET